MFTGIIEKIGTLIEVTPKDQDTQIWIEVPQDSDFDLKEVTLGDSIAINGCCLTVTEKRHQKGSQAFGADLSPETLSKTAFGDLQVGDSVNLERALRLGDRLGGHWVQGHVDGVGELVDRQVVTSGKESYHLLKIKVPEFLAHTMIAKGSVAVDGISLTINEVHEEAQGVEISLCIIPHTLERTTLTGKKPGARLHLEADYLVKIVENLMKKSKVIQ